MKLGKFDARYLDDDGNALEGPPVKRDPRPLSAYHERQRQRAEKFKAMCERRGLKVDTVKGRQKRGMTLREALRKPLPKNGRGSVWAENAKRHHRADHG